MAFAPLIPAMRRLILSPCWLKMPESFDKLVERARFIGVHQVAYPLDIFSLASDISEHEDSWKKFEKLLPLINDAENYFTRWTAVRAIRQMGLAAVKRAESQLSTQLRDEDYELAKEEIQAALALLSG